MVATADIGDVGGLISGIAAGILALTAVLTAVFGLRTYSQQVKEKRGRWLGDLAGRLASEQSIVTVRSQLYNERGSALAEALERKEAARDRPERFPLSDEDTRLLVALDDYLDFLGLVHLLIETGELGEDEAAALFTWYVDQPMKVPQVQNEIGQFFPEVADLHARFIGRPSRTIF